MRAPTGTLLRIGMLLSVGLVVLTGCSDDPEPPSTLPDNGPSVTSSPASPSPNTPEEQVEAAVRAYYAELTRAAQTNDTSKLRTLTTKGCPCYRPVEVINGNLAKGRTTPDASFELDAIRVHDIEGRTALAEVRTDEAAYEVFNESDTVIGKVDARSNLLDLSLIRSASGQWVIANEFDLRGSA